MGNHIGTFIWEKTNNDAIYKKHLDILAKNYGIEANSLYVDVYAPKKPNDNETLYGVELGGYQLLYRSPNAVKLFLYDAREYLVKNGVKIVREDKIFLPV